MWMPRRRGPVLRCGAFAVLWRRVRAIAHHDGMAQEMSGKLPRVKCPATLGGCGGRSIAVHPIAKAVGRGKVADHKASAHALVLCEGSGQTVALPRTSMIQLTTDEAPRMGPRAVAPPLPLFEVPD